MIDMNREKWQRRYANSVAAIGAFGIGTCTALAIKDDTNLWLFLLPITWVIVAVYFHYRIFWRNRGNQEDPREGNDQS